MSGCLNEANIIGNLAADPDIKHTSDGRPVCNLRVATNESWRDKATGERKERAEFHRVVIFSEGLCGIAEKYLHKGSKVFLRGQLQTRKWQDQTGADKYSTEIVLQGFNSTLVMLDGKGGGGERNPDDDINISVDGKSLNLDGQGATKGFGDLDDEIPFAPEWRG